MNNEVEIQVLVDELGDVGDVKRFVLKSARDVRLGHV